MSNTNAVGTHKIRRGILATVALVTIIGAVAAAVGVISIGTVTRHIGVNYLSLYHQYNTSDDRLQHDFALFAKNGINTIVITLYWYRVELSQGVYDKQFISNVTRVIKIANDYGLSVMIDFHTLIGDSDAWSNPTYVGVGENLISKPQISADYLAMVRWTISQLKGLTNVWAYSVLNEPWYWPLESSSKSKWINLINQLTQTVKTVDPKPVTVRFIGEIFSRDWTWDSTLLGSLDFLSINAYLSPNTTDTTYWNSWDKVKTGLSDIVRDASTFGKKVQITEFGYSTPNDAVQEAIYYEYLAIFKQLPNVSGWLSWGWDSSYDPNNPSWSANGEFSIDVQSTGTPRPAFYILSSNT